MSIDTQADIHADELGNEAQDEELREMATKNAVVTLFSNQKGVMVSPGAYMGIHQILCAVADSPEEFEAIRLMCNGDSRPARALYEEVAYNLLYPYADFLISNNSQPF